MTKKKLLPAAVIALGFLFFVSCDRNRTQNNMNITPGKSVENLLGKDIIDILQDADSVESYNIEQFKANRPNLLAGYPIISRGSDLSPEQRRALQQVLFDDKSYDFIHRKKCLFVPQFGIKIKKGDQAVVVLLYYGCDMMVFAHGENEIMTNFDPAHHQMQEITGALFPETKGGSR